MPAAPTEIAPALPAARAGRLAYAWLTRLALPFVWARLAWRARAIPALRGRWAERRGGLPFAPHTGGVWLHTVSAGETIAAAPLVRALAARHPDWPLLLTTTTHTGSERVRALLGDRVQHAYAPYDAAAYVARRLDAVRPRLVVLFETELWPHLIEACHERGIPVLLANARLSERSARGYARLGALARRMLRQLDFVACQSAAHAARFAALGVAPARIAVLGNLKFDVLPGDPLRARAAALRAAWPFAGRRVWIAGSTHPGEEAQVLAAHALLRAHAPDALLVLVPRHPERAAAVAAACAPLAAVKFSTLASDGAPRATHGHGPGVRVNGVVDRVVDVLVGDTMGDLAALYGTAEVAFVGGSLVDAGGHNPLEPIALGVPVLVGPSERNFTDLLAPLHAAAAVQRVRDARELAAAVAQLWADPALARRLAEAAAAVVAPERGACERLLACIESMAERGASTAGGTGAAGRD